MLFNPKLNGETGIYDNKVSNNSVKYGRNAINNSLDYLEKNFLTTEETSAPILDFSSKEQSQDKNIEMLEAFTKKNDEYLSKLPPIEFEYRYMPNLIQGKIDKLALLGAAYEEIGAKEVDIEDFENNFLIDNTFTAKPLDINNDNKIDIAEYGANILATDLLSKNSTDINKIDGTINSKGLNAVLEYTKKANAQAASELYSNIYNTYDLGSALDELDLD